MKHILFCKLTKAKLLWLNFKKDGLLYGFYSNT